MSHETIDYPMMIDNAMRGVVRSALEHVQQHGLPGDHHFFVSLQTQYPGVQISPQLKERYPDEITIVVQHQFWDLHVDDVGFSMMLSFNNIPEKLIVPWDSLTAFADPSIKFGLQFHGKAFEEDGEKLSCPATGKTGKEKPSAAGFDEDEPRDEAEPANDSKVVSLENFRKR